LSDGHLLIDCKTRAWDCNNYFDDVFASSTFSAGSACSGIAGQVGQAV